MIKLRKTVKWCLITLLSLLLIIALALGFLLFTTPGLQITQKVTNHFLQPFGIRLKGNISGRINQLKLDELDIKNDTVDIRLNKIELSLSLWSLISDQTLDVKRLSLNKVYVDVNTHSTDENNDNPTYEDSGSFSMPLDLYAKNIHITNVQYLMNKQLIVDAADFNADGVNLVHDKLALNKVAANVPAYATSTTVNSGYIILNSPFKTHLKVSLNAQQSGTNITSTQTQIIGDFAGKFSIASDGIIHYKTRPYPYSLISSFDQGIIVNQLKLDHLAVINNTLLLNDQLDWSVKLASLNPAVPLKFNIGGTLKTTDHDLKVKTSFCDIFSTNTHLHCYGSLSSSNDTFQLNQFKLVNPQNDDLIQIKLTQSKQNIQANWKVFINTLSNYPVNISGKVYSRGKIDVDNRTAKSLKLTLDVHDFLYKQFDLSKLILAVDQHALTLNVDSNQMSTLIKMQLQNLSLSQITAKLETLNFTSKTFKQNWHLTKAVDLALSPDKSSISNLCLLASNDNHFCINAEVAPNNIHIQTAGELTPAQFIPNLPYGGDSFALSFKGDYLQVPNSDPKANFSLSGHGFFFANNTSWFKQLQQIMPMHQLSYTTTINTKLTLQDQKLILKSNISFPQNALELKLNSHNFDLYNLSNAKLNGAIYLSSTRLNWISNFIPQFPTLINKGDLHSHLQITNTLFDPHVTGNIILKNTQIELLPLNTTLDDINANIFVSNPLNAKINLTANIQKSPLTVTGFANLHGATANTNININGKKLLVLNTPDMEVTVSPTLSFNQNNGSSKLSGNIFINKLIVNLADMKSSSLQNTIQNDVVYVNNNNQAIQTQKSTPFNMNLNIDMGKNAHISGLGLDTNIQGKLNIISQPNQPMLGIGTLQPVNGVFNAYGKSFTVAPKSTIQFNNSPVDNPMLAITTFYNIPTSVKLTQANAPDTIGIEITGMANNPKIQLFSDPSMSQTDILSYILFGQVLSNTNSSQASSDALSQAALLIALNEGGSSVIDELKDKLSLAEFSLGNLNNTTNNTTTEQNNTAVFIGKQITPRLYLSYGVGVFTGEQQGIATFSLTPQWKLKGEVTSFDRGGDILYQTHSEN
ncbi:translocation/assembly module TamB domain-containing protein [Cysteiniphilum halobium]|uniref:translocation/assembly module TamB domain-containing protein n=1 Tax=Cysteiniphilum halobium TaxID=2219059 RepID=UPI000E64B02B|nr:translocation/assembly module TamB domain-containing protein [Cysteiniphilum halobium]